MNVKCDRCEKPAEVHEIDVSKGIQVHLCREHALEAGFELPDAPPVTKLLSDLASMQVQISSGGSGERRHRGCETCGTTFGQFRKTGLLGCPACYETFAKQLESVIGRSQNGAAAHIGRVPDQAANLVDQQALRRSILDEIDRAVASEQYERAARLRDRLHTLAEEGSS